nr:MAG TPA: hypothetical protein [Caudoviricetes sp.]
MRAFFLGLFSSQSILSQLVKDKPAGRLGTPFRRE